MPKVIAHYSKKVPTGDYSNENFSASIEAEIASASPETAREALRRLFQTVRDSVEEQFQSSSSQNRHSPRSTQPAPTNGTHAMPTNGVSNGRFVPATASQRKAVFAICKSLGLDHQQYDIDRLSVKQASQLIDELKGQQAGSR